MITTTMNQPIRARVTLENTTIHNTNQPGMAGMTTIIGQFPSTDKNVASFTTLQEVRSHFNIVKNSKREQEFLGAKCAKRLFMEGVREANGVTSLTCVNIYNGTENDLKKYNSINQDGAGNTSTTVNSGSNTSQAEGTVTDGEETGGQVSTSNTNTDLQVSYSDIELALKKISHETTNILNISVNLAKLKEVAAGTMSILEVWDKIIAFVDDKFTSQKPSYIIGAITTKRTGSLTITNDGVSGVGCTSVDIFGDSGKGYTINSNGKKEYTKNFNAGVKQISECFTSGVNELTTAALYAVGGEINGEQVDSIELAAHMAGWIAGLNVGVDVTNKEIPGLTGIDEELLFGENDAGYLLTNMGIQVIEPLSRLNNTYCVQNGVTPLGWHTNHVRSVAYLINELGLKGGLGINNLQSEVQAFRAALNSVSSDVMDVTDAITDVTFGEVTAIDAWRVEVPLDIELAGVVTEIHASVSMTLRDYSQTASSQYITSYNI